MGKYFVLKPWPNDILIRLDVEVDNGRSRFYIDRPDSFWSESMKNLAVIRYGQQRKIPRWNWPYCDSTILSYYL